MQIVRYNDGEFALYKIATDNGYVSAWYDSNGVLLDWEKRHNHCTTSRLAKGDRERLIALGKVWKQGV